MYTFIDFSSYIVAQRRVPCPTNKEGSHAPLSHKQIGFMHQIDVWLFVLQFSCFVFLIYDNKIFNNYNCNKIWSQLQR